MPPAKKKRTKQSQRPPETADEYLAEAVSLEESAEKWRAGDAQKAARFYTRALNLYDEAIPLFPASFDLVYNKSRIQYEIAQRPLLRAQFPDSLEHLLRSALDTHRQALRLEPNDADALFNTGQVLTSLAEAVDDETSAALMLREALALFQSCMQRQEALLQESEAQKREAHRLLQEEDLNFADDGGISLDQSERLAPDGLGSREDSNSAAAADQWAAIVNPVTHTSLIETSVSFLSALSALCSLITQPSDLQLLNASARQLLDEKIPDYLNNVEDVEAREDLISEGARFRTAYSESEFKLKLVDFDQYDRAVKDIFEPIIQSVQNSAVFLVCYAEALVALANATSQLVDKAVPRYLRLSRALELLAQASKVPNAKDLPSIHLARGDAEMLRFMLCRTGNLPENLSNDSVKQTLLANAATYYRGSATMAQAASTDLLGEILVTALTKEAAVKSILTQNNAPIHELQSNGINADRIQNIIIDMIDESLITDTDLRGAQIS